MKISINARNELKTATQAIHDVIDSSSIAKHIVSSSITIDNYITFLKINYGFVRAFEIALSNPEINGQIDTFFEKQDKSFLIIQDLKTLGCPSTILSKLPLMKGLPLIDNPVKKLAALYVIEGSTMGGLFIAKHVEKILGINKEKGGLFLHGQHGPKIAAQRFKSFISMLNSYPWDRQSMDTAKVTAVNCFQAIANWFKDNSQ